MNLNVAIHSLNQTADAWLASAATGLLTVMVLAALGASINRFISPALRCWLWWLLCVRLIVAAFGGFARLPQVAIPVSLSTFASARAPVPPASASNIVSERAAVAERPTGAAAVTPDASVTADPQAAISARPTVATYLLLFWIIGAACSIGAVVRESLILNRSLRSARDLSDNRLGADMREIAARMGIASPPLLVEVTNVSSPFVAGFRCPVLAFPLGLDTTLSPHEVKMALAHELAHLRRGDLYLAWIPQISRALCFCVPFLPAFVCSQWATAREAACDSTAMDATEAAPGAYSQVLMKIVRGDSSAHRTPLFTLGATASFHTLRARLQLIRDRSESRRANRAWIAVCALLALCAILPWRAASLSMPAKLAPLVPLATPDDAKDVAYVTAFSTFADNDPDKRYILIGGRPGTSAPPEGYRLVVVLPGGDGSANFNYFVRRLQQRALGENYLVAELVAKQWDARQSQEIVWPTRTSPWVSMRFSTEEFAEAVVRDVEARYPVDHRQVFSLSWASGGPAGYSLSLSPGTPIAGSFVAMSTFAPWTLPSLAAARGHAYYLLHPDSADAAPLSVAYSAESLLRQNGADVKLATYAGGYGWNGDVYGQVRRGMQYLEDHTAH